MDIDFKWSYKVSKSALILCYNNKYTRDDPKQINLSLVGALCQNIKKIEEIHETCIYAVLLRKC